MTADLSALIARLEAAKAGSRELDAEVLRALGYSYHLDFGCGWFSNPKHHGRLYGNGQSSVTTSLDAALALAERVLPEGRMIGIQQNRWSDLVEQKRRAWAAYIEWHEDGENFEISPVAPTPALALCIATLRAKLEAEAEVNKNPKAQEG